LRRGFLEENQLLEWNHDEHGVSLRSRFLLPFSAGERIPDLATGQLAELNSSLRFIERKLAE
jgi:hypothetical protein